MHAVDNSGLVFEDGVSNAGHMHLRELLLTLAAYHAVVRPPPEVHWLTD